MIEKKAHPIGARQFNALVQNLGDLVTVHDSKGRIRYATPSTARLLGYSERALIGKNAFELIHPEDMDGARAAFESVIALKNRGTPTEYRVRRYDGTWIDVETIGTNFLSDPAIRGLVFTSRVVTERKRHERQLSAIATVGGALRSAGTRAEMLPIILDHVVRLIGVDGAAFAIREATSDQIVIELGRGRAAAATGLRLQPAEGVTGYVISTGQPYRIANLASDPLFASSDLVKAEAGAQVMAACLPLKAGDQTIGTLWVEKAARPGELQAGIDDEQIQLLTAIAEMSANAIHRASLNEQTQLRLRRLVTLQTIDLAVSRSLDLHVTLNLLLGEITLRLNIDAADVLLVDPKTQELKSVASRGFTTGFISRSEPVVGRSLGQRARLDRRLLFIAERAAGDLPEELRPILEAEGFASYCGLPLIATGRTVGVLELFQRSQLPADPEWLDYLDGLAAHVAVAVEKISLIQDLRQGNAELARAYDGLIEVWTRALALRGHEELEHTRRVTNMSVALARLLRWDSDKLVQLWRGAMLHDIGQLVLPDAVLLKREPYSEGDWEIVRQHPVRGFELMSAIDSLRTALDIPYCHHERWDGTGYPRGLKGSDIPEAAQIFCIMDVYDAITSQRPYRPAWTEEEAVGYIHQEAGKSFNPQLVELFIEHFAEIVGKPQTALAQ